jgi:predicted nucleotidyltransferase
MSVLAELLSSKTRAEILRVLFGLSSGEVHLREIMRRSGFSINAIRNELKKLERLDLVSVRRNGNRLYYTANKHHPLYSTLRVLVLKTNGLAERLRARLMDPKINMAFVYGSIAEGKEKASSDVDLFVIGSVNLRTLVSKMAGLTEEIGREINPFLIKPEEYRRRLRTKDHFVTQVLASPRIFIIGGEDEFEAMGRERMAQISQNDASRDQQSSRDRRS